MASRAQWMLSQLGMSAVAATLGVSRHTVQRWKNGIHAPSPETKKILLARYKIPIGAWEDDDVSTPVSAPAPEPAPDPETPAPDAASETERSLRDQLARLRAIRARDPDMATGSLLRLEASETKLIQLLAQATGESDVVSESKIMKSQAWRRIRETITGALDPYPEAAMAVADALSDLE